MSQPKSIYELVREWPHDRAHYSMELERDVFDPTCRRCQVEALLREWDKHLLEIGDDGLWMGAVQGRKKILGLPGEKP